MENEVAVVRESLAGAGCAFGLRGPPVLKQDFLHSESRMLTFVGTVATDKKKNNIETTQRLNLGFRPRAAIHTVAAKWK